jgi:16S rRNA (cytosine1402-N4)-methyltransferase
MTTLHIPVLVQEAIQFVVKKPTGIFVDCTLGTGGHTQALSKVLNPDAYIIGIDADPGAVNYCSQNLSIAQPHQFVNANFADLKRICYRAGFQAVDGILMDLGLSSFALDDPARGLAFSQDGPLNMRFSPAIAQSAADFINSATEKEMIHAFQEYGEERHSVRIARLILTERAKSSITTTAQLATIIRSAAPGP